MKKMNCIIVDDELLARRGIEMFINNFPFLELIASCNDPLEALREIKNNDINLMFLDVQMPRMSGIEMLRDIPGLPITIVTTAYPGYALESFELNVIDYLVKPISYERFTKAVTKARDYFNLQNPASTGEPSRFIFIKCDNQLVKVEFDDIQYVEAMGNYVAIRLNGGQLVTYLTIKSLEEFLPADNFIRVNKSQIIALSKIDSIRGNEVIMAGKSFIIGRQYRDQVFNRILGNSLIRKK